LDTLVLLPTEATVYRGIKMKVPRYA
jgi:hypothetical protein